MVAELAMKWTHVLRTGAVGVRFTGVDLNTIMFNMDSIKDLEEVWFPFFQIQSMLRKTSSQTMNDKCKIKWSNQSHLVGKSFDPPNCFSVPLSKQVKLVAKN